MRPGQGLEMIDPAAELRFRRAGRPGRGLRRKVGLRFHHAVFFILLLAALFAGLQRLCLFLLDWEHLRLTRIEVWPAQNPLGDKVEKAASRLRSSSLLALDTSRLASEIESFSWVKEARIRKIFPSTLRIEVTLRSPMAVLDRGVFFLVDQDGVLLAPADAADASRWPRLIDRGHFQEDYRDKIVLARACLSSLSAALRDKVETLDLSEADCLSLKLRNDSVRLILGAEGFAIKVNTYLRQAAYWAAAFGRPEAVDFRIRDRAYLRLAAGTARPLSEAGRREVM